MGTESKTYNGAFVASPLPNELVTTWTRLSMNAIQTCRFQEILINKNLKSKKPHVTFFYLGEINDKVLKLTSNFLSKNSHILQDLPITFKSVEVIGQNKKALVINLDKSPKLVEFRSRIEKALPMYININLPFKPHITILELNHETSVNSGMNWVKSLNESFGQSAILRRISIYGKQSNSSKIENLFSKKL